MSALMTESYLFWIVTAAVCVVVGIAFKQGLGKSLYLWSGVACAVVSIVLGVVFVFFVDTDAKSIRRTIRNVELAVEANDVERALTYVAQSSTQLRETARTYMSIAKIENAKVSQLEIDEINPTTSPPRARVSFRASANGEADVFGPYPFTVLVDFVDVELRKEQDGVWRVTDHCEFRRVGAGSDGAAPTW